MVGLVCSFCLLLLPLAMQVASFERGDDDSAASESQPLAHLPSILVAFFARNKGHTLPQFLGALEEFDYDKGRLSLFIRTDHNSDQTEALLSEWVERVRSFYEEIDYELIPSEEKYDGEAGPSDWPEERFRHLMALKESALQKARDGRFDFVLFLDCDQFLTNPKTLQHLMGEKEAVVAPMLRAVDSNYSNFWAGVNEEGYYRKTEDYIPILFGQVRGCFPVPMIHSVVLVDLRIPHTLSLSFEPPENYAGPVDDILIFAASVRASGLQMFIVNKVDFGVLLPPSTPNSSLLSEIEEMRYLLLEAHRDGPPGLLHSPFLPPWLNMTRDKLGFDKIYLINLERRADRRTRMEACLQVLQLNATLWAAVDGKLLTSAVLDEMGIQLLPEYFDPYHKRPMTMGEVACFLSHYRIWEEVARLELGLVLVLEDDLRFVKYFRPFVRVIFDDIRNSDLDWDLIYIGRKRLDPDKDGPFLPNSRHLAHVSYSYWTLGYMLTLSGARKLLAGDPLKRLVPVDEYLPIMFDQHPESSWKNRFPVRNLAAFTAEPLLVHPTHYTGDPGYVSDTEDSVPLDDFVSQPLSDIGTASHQASLNLAKDEL